MSEPTLLIFSGLPGCGKSTLAKRLSTQLSATYLRIDSIEVRLKNLYQEDVDDRGYQLAFQLAADNLVLGQSVVADSCNSVAESRVQWHKVAESAQVKYIDIEIICSDIKEHQKRVESRHSDIEGLILPTWQQVEDREFLAWQTPIITLDTAGKSIEASTAELRRKLAAN